jgi:hypothetical protein
MTNRLTSPLVAAGLSLLTACTKPEIVDVPDMQIDQGISDVVESVRDQFVLNIDQPVTFNERDLYGADFDVITPGRFKYTTWRNMKLRRTSKAYPYDERPIIESYEYKIMADFIFNYSRVLEEHYMNYLNLNFYSSKKRGEQRVVFSDDHTELRLELLQDRKISLHPVTGEKVYTPYILEIKLRDFHTNEQSVNTIDFTTPLPKEVANEFMRMFKIMIDSKAFEKENFFKGLYKESDRVLYPESISLPMYHSKIRNLGFYNHDRFFADAICEDFPTSHGGISYDYSNTPKTNYDHAGCMILTNEDSQYAKKFASVYDKFEGTFPVLFVSRMPDMHRYPYVFSEPFKMRTLDVGFVQKRCSLEHSTLDNIQAHNYEKEDYMANPFYGDMPTNGNMGTEFINLLLINGVVSSPTLVTMSNFQNGRRNNVPITTYSHANFNICK